MKEGESAEVEQGKYSEREEKEEIRSEWNENQECESRSLGTGKQVEERKMVRRKERKKEGDHGPRNWKRQKRVGLTKGKERKEEQEGR